MNKFIFKFQKLLDLKNSEKEQAKRELGISISKLKSLEKKIEELNEKYKRHAYYAIESTPFYEKVRRNYLNYLSEEIKNNEKLAETLSFDVELKRKILTEKQIEFKMYEKLQEKDQEEYLTDLNKKDSTNNDDLSISVYIRNGGGNK